MVVAIRPRPSRKAAARSGNKRCFFIKKKKGENVNYCWPEVPPPDVELPDVVPLPPLVELPVPELLVPPVVEPFIPLVPPEVEPLVPLVPSVVEPPAPELPLVLPPVPESSVLMPPLPPVVALPVSPVPAAEPLVPVPPLAEPIEVESAPVLPLPASEVVPVLLVVEWLWPQALSSEVPRASVSRLSLKKCLRMVLRKLMKNEEWLTRYTFVFYLIMKRKHVFAAENRGDNY